MGRNDPIEWILGLLLLPFVLVYRLIIEPIIALVLSIVSLLWFCIVELPLKLSELTDRLQIASYSIDIINNLLSEPLPQGIIHSVHPVVGIIIILGSGYILYLARYEINRLISDILRHI
jgi:hypothetical protein